MRALRIGPTSLPAVRRRRRRRGPAIAIVLLVVLGAGIGGSALAYASVRSQAVSLEANVAGHLDQALHDLESGKDTLVQGNAKRDASLVTQAKLQFTAAGVQFKTAAQIADRSQFLRSLEGYPLVGQSVRSRHATVDSIAAMGESLAGAGVDLSGLAASLISPPSSGNQAGRSLLAVLHDADATLTGVKTELMTAQAQSQGVDVGMLSTSQLVKFERARSAIDGALAQIDVFRSITPSLTEILGGNGPRTYLIEQVNPAELRAGGGFIGTYSLIRADNGSITLLTSGNATELAYPRASAGQPGYVQPPGAIRELIGNTSWSFFDSNFFPDFPSNASAAISFAQPRLGSHIDAVISIDYYAVARMLDITGALQVPGFNISLNSGNFIPLVIQYDIAAYTDVSSGLAHKAILSAAAGPLMQRLSSLPPTQWGVLIGALNDLASAHHIQANFNNATVQTQMDRFGWSGVMRTGMDKDFLMEVESNLRGTKANYYVARHYRVELTRSGQTLHHTVTVDVYDDMAYTYRPNEFYRAYVRLYVPGDAVATWDDLVATAYPNPAPPPGTRVLDGWFLIHGYGHDRVVTFEYDTPWHGNGRGEEAIYWQKQPGTQTDSIEVRWTDGNGHVHTTSGALDQDRVIVLASTGVFLRDGIRGSAQIPSLSLG